MDTSGFCEVGRYGTLSVLKRQCDSIHDNVIASFGIDDEELTFGSSTACGVRLYYPDVDSLHCKIVFDQYKAFLAILGTSGALVDGCKVFPHTSSENSGSTKQTIIPLTNNTVFEIHGKRFRFTYPPKEMRKALYATPARPPKRALRLSMIHSAQVFSPRPSNDPRENLKILQSPMKNPSRSPFKQNNPSPLKSSILPESEPEEAIVLVHTSHPRVVEEDKDLVILEDIPVELLSPSKSAVQQFPVLRTQTPPQTPPRRKSLGGTALHRAVLIRSAQRAVMKAEKEKEEEEEEMEVLDTVVEDEARRPIKINNCESEDTEMQDMDEDEADEDIEGQEKVVQKSIWRASLEKIIPWSSSSSIAETEGQDYIKFPEDVEATETEQSTRPSATLTPSRQALGSFMTPQYQVSRKNIFPSVDAPAGSSVGPSRLSLGGGEAKRVIIQQPWKVRDLVLPPAAPFIESRPLMPFDPPTSVAENGIYSSLNRQNAGPMEVSGPYAKTPGRGRLLVTVSEEERKAIQERRRSAVKELNDTSFWAGGAPGMSPVKRPPVSNLLASYSPKKLFGSSSGAQKPESRSPTKERPLTDPILEEDHDNDVQSIEDDLDTHGLLEKMKETVNDMKRRRSILLGDSARPGSTPQRMPVTPAAMSSMSHGNDIKKIDLTNVGTPSRPSLRAPTPKLSSRTNPARKEKLVEIAQGESLSHVGPGAVNPRNQPPLPSTSQDLESDTIMPVSLPVVTVDPGPDDGLSEEHPQPGLSSQPRDATEQDPDIEMEHDVDHETEAAVAKLTTKPNLTRRQRSRTPQPPLEQEVATTTRVTRRGKKPGPMTESEQDHKQANPVKRGRTPHEVVEKETTPPVIPKRGRPRNKAANTPKAREKPPSSTSRKPASKLRSYTQAKPVYEEDIDNEDPLDSYEVPNSEEDTEAESSPPTVVVAKAKPKTTANRRKPTRVKEEEDSDEVTPAVPARVKRSTRVNAASQPAVTPAARPPTSKTRGRPKTPATAPATISEISVDPEKENAPGTMSMEKASEPDVEEAPVVKLRVSRSRAGTGRKATKVEDDEQHLAPARQKSTRTMRTRTKTG